MSLVCKRLPVMVALVASIAAAWAIDKDKKNWKPGPASSFESKQSSDGVTIAAAAYTSEDEIKQAFDKMNPYRNGVLPVLVVIQNDTKEALRLDAMRVQYIDASRQKIDSTPAAEVPYLHAPQRPNMNPSPIPRIPGVGGKRKNPLDGPQIELRAFAAKMLPPGESAHGFFYFRTGHRPGAKLFITDVRLAASGKDLLYFELPLD